MKTLTLTNSRQMQPYLDQVWALLVASYSEVSGGLHYAEPADLLSKTQRWRLVTYRGRVIASTLFKAKRGWKLVAMASCRQHGLRARHALRRLICADLPRAWMELSERAERFVLRCCGGHHYLIHASLAATLLDKPVEPVAEDGYHYRRTVAGLLKAKVIVGTPLPC
ncbi:hypothetical protein ACK30K_16695 [Aeromonas caviae]|uniref:hypothetical protein n=1 Tax=Aeromonas caviae TaxID=648 RepID=UPI0038D019B9